MITHTLTQTGRQSVYLLPVNLLLHLKFISISLDDLGGVWKNCWKVDEDIMVFSLLGVQVV